MGELTFKETNDYSIYNADCMDILTELPDSSIDLSIYSPPFAGLYNYSSSPRDFSNVVSKEEFLTQYEFLIEEKTRVTKSGRISAVHVSDFYDHNGYLWDLPAHIIELHKKHHWRYANRITVWKEPLRVRTRTMVQSLMHKFIIEDSTKCFPAMPDYILIFKRSGDNEIPVTHQKGLTYYAGEMPFLEAHKKKFGKFEDLQNMYKDWKDPYTNKLSHIIWQRYASSVWDDIRVDNILSFKNAKEDDDEKHVHPLQLDIIDRLVILYSNKNETILTPFMGVGSEVFSSVSWGRKSIGIELKKSYYNQAIKNLELVGGRFNDDQSNLL